MGGSDRRWMALVLGLALWLGSGVGSGCMNGAMHNYKAQISETGPGGRFALVIEADRTRVDGSHFLLDTATGDVWRLEAQGARAGTWARLADAPPDAADLEEDPDDDA